MTTENIKKNFKKILIDAGVDIACKKMNFEFEKDFLDPASKKVENYKKYKWYVLEHSKVGSAIHAVPPINESDILPWEEWFIFDNKKVHNILFTKKQSRCDGEFEGTLDDKDHPKEVLGMKWYYYFDSSFIPKLFLD